MTATAQVLPFQFDAHEVRTLLIDDQPWFVAADVAASLGYPSAPQMTRNLDDEEKGMQNVHTLGGSQEMLVINESGLYSAILRSRKTEAKRFKRWVTGEVLPAIRQHGRYDIANTTIGTDGLQILHELIGKKIKVLPNKAQRQARARLWGLVHTRFNVPRGEMIPASELDTACNFVAACAIDGQWLPAPSNDEIGLGEADRQNLYALCTHMLELRRLYRHYRLYDALKMLGSDAGIRMNDRITDGYSIAYRYSNRLAQSRELSKQ